MKLHLALFISLLLCFGMAYATDPWGNPGILTASMSLMTQVTLNGVPAASGDALGAFVTVSGNPQLRGKALVQVINGTAGCLIQIYTETNGETISFKVWDESLSMAFDASQTLPSEVNGIVGSWPNNLYQINASGTLPQVATPTFTPVAGTYTTARNVSISCATPGSQIRYTTNGTEPTASSAVYSTPINCPLNSTTTIKAKGFKTEWTPSATATGVYVITGTVTTPTFSPAAGLYPTAQNVTIACSTADAQIRYTTDGTEPSATSALYSVPINCPSNATTTIKSKGFKTDWLPSITVTAVYIINPESVSTPTFTPGAGTYNGAVDVVISCDIPGSTIRYTINETEPDYTSSQYTTPLHLAVSTTVKAKAFYLDWIPSNTATAEYLVITANPDEPYAPIVTGISQVYPNPFSTSTTIVLGIKECHQGYKLSIYNIRGECVYRTQGMASGMVQLTWNGTDSTDRKLPAGVYLLSFESGATKQTRKLALK